MLCVNTDLLSMREWYTNIAARWTLTADKKKDLKVSAVAVILRKIGHEPVESKIVLILSNLGHNGATRITLALSHFIIFTTLWMRNVEERIQKTTLLPVYQKCV